MFTSLSSARTSRRSLGSLRSTVSTRRNFLRKPASLLLCYLTPNKTCPLLTIASQGKDV
jgi:hypothetical protein